MTAPRGRYARKDWRKLLTSRKGAASIGLVCLLGAGAVVIAAMSNYRSSVNQGGKEQTVFVAAQMIARNTPASVIASENLVKPAQFRASQVVAGALADTSALHGTVAAKDIYPGEQLTGADFTANSSLPAQLGPDERAMTISLDSAHGMVGTIQTGDHVDVYAGFQLQTASAQNQPVLRLLIADVPVLKAPSGATTGLGGSTNSNATSNATLEVNSSQAAALAYAADNGKVWLVLRPAHANATPPPSAVTVQSLLFGSKPVSTGGK
jgi:Flp pilus assembly protein CpaB